MFRKGWSLLQTSEILKVLTNLVAMVAVIFCPYFS